MTELFAVIGLGIACMLWYLIGLTHEEICGEPDGGTPEGCSACGVPPEARDCHPLERPIEIGR